jgi:2-polyprenyl-3-methyl-5-hydroxy-6-metoxy-1,4-benzoquinol methylase
VRCASCGVLFSDVDRATYEADQRNVWHSGELSAGTTAFYGAARERAQDRFLAAYPPAGPGRRLLDLGCGLGFFVSRALEDGWEAFGCDTSQPWAEQAARRAGAERIILGAVEEIPAAAGRFDLITSWDVLEHIFEPLPFLRAARRLLAPGGRLFLRTPNEAWVYPSYLARRLLLGEAVELGPLNHVVYYRAATLRLALGRAGLSPTDWPGLPPPQVGYANRDTALGARRALVVAAKNAHAAAARGLARASAGRLVLGSDLDVVACARIGGAA